MRLQDHHAPTLAAIHAQPVSVAGVTPALGVVPMPAVARILSGFDRPTLEAFLSVAVELLDVADGDPDDFDTDGDENDSDGDEKGDHPPEGA